MEISSLFSNKALKPKEKSETLCNWLLEEQVGLNQLISYATTAKDPIRATCIEAMEFLAQKNPEKINKKAFEFALNQLTSKAPRVKWESAK